MSDRGSEASSARAIQAVLVAAVLTALFVYLIATDHSWGGPVVLVLSATHGVHLGDLPVLVLWLAGLAGCVRWAVQPRARNRTRR